MRGHEILLIALTATAGSTTVGSSAAPHGAVVFDNAHYPQCCKSDMPGIVCMYRIPVVLHIPATDVVLAFAEARLGYAYNSSNGCSDGAGPGLPMRRSTDKGATWEPMRWIANDTQPSHVAVQDHIVMGMAIYDPRSKTSFLFYTACYQRCVYTTTYVISSKDEGATWSSPSAGNLTDMLLEGPDGISMMQFGEGQGVVVPGTGELIVCGWFKRKGRPPGELDKTDSIACLSSVDAGANWKIKGRLPAPLPEPFNEVTIGLMQNNSMFLSMRSNKKVPLRYQARSDDAAATFSVPRPGELPAPTCNAGTINLDSETLVLAHIEPNRAVRENMTIRASTDSGATWPYRKLIWDGPAGYVTLTSTEVNNTIGALFENGDSGSAGACYSRISYQQIVIPPINSDT
jgi:sialidase-1|eukprot:COSAG02_NODE_6_length_64796_cov_76.792865_13_plen_402_part_00